MDEATSAFVLRVLQITGVFAGELCGDIYWRTDGEYAPVTFWIGCNDLFDWGSADSEQITPENLPILERSIADATASCEVGRAYASTLFCCRVRGMRPQGACYPKEKALWPLLDACGPERKVGFGNPYPPGGKP